MGKFSKPRDPSSLPEAAEEILPAAPQDPDLPDNEAETHLMDEVSEADAFLTEEKPVIEEPVIPQPVAAVSDSIAAKKAAPKAKKRSKLLIALCSMAGVLMAGIIAALVFLFVIDPNGGKILNNVTVGGIDVSNMNRSEARAAIRAATDHTYTQRDLVISFPDTELNLSPADTGAQLDVNALVDMAYDYGRVGTDEEKAKALADSATTVYAIDFLPYLTLNRDYIRQTLDNYGNGFNSIYSASTAALDGDMPILDGSVEGFTGEIEDRNLVIYTGTPGRYIDIDKVYDRVLEAYNQNHFELTVDMEEPETLPETINLKALYDQLYSEVKDASVDPETFEVTMEVYGYEFDLEAAQALLDDASYGDTITVPMKLTAPEVLGGPYRDIYFRDVLCEYQTEHTSNEKRNTNLTLACAAINGTVLAPGEEFDYNTVVGERTREKGYQAAPAYSSGKTVQDVGGGVCQVSSTIYYCCLISDLEIINRMPHSYVSNYMPMGMDATVNWGGPEFTFKNNTNYPIRIETWVADGYVHCKLVGTDEKDYYIEMEYEVTGSAGYEIIYEEYPPDNPEGYKNNHVIQTPYRGYWVNTYKLKYDKETGELISREFDRQSIYKKRDKIIAKIVKPVEPTEPAGE